MLEYEYNFCNFSLFFFFFFCFFTNINNSSTPLYLFQIVYEAEKKEGSHFILQDSELKNTGTMVIVTPNMKMTLSKTYSTLRKLCHALSTKKKSESNMPSVANFFEKFSLNYYDQSYDQCK